jgi:hypothetical protein
MFGGFMKTRLPLLLAIILLALPACGPAAPDFGCADTVRALSTLRQDLTTPEHLLTENPVEDGTEFDPNSYFEVFTHLAMQDGYSLDFVYTYGDMGGFPTLFATQQEQGALRSWADVPAGIDSYLYHVRVDDTPEGFLQFAILASTSEQFYLDWHANYNDLQIVCNRKTVKSIVKTIQRGDYGQTLTAESRAQALDIRDVEPTVTIGDQTVEVRLLTFTKWGGFYRATYTLNRSFPHIIVDMKQEPLAPYNCGIVF